ncbi:MAG: murein L,D-transpeptidase family protein [Candidatus Obscuribacterales bacterium]
MKGWLVASSLFALLLFAGDALGLTMGEALQRYAEDARARIEPFFRYAGVQYPPEKLVMVALKEEALLYLFARESRTGRMRQVRCYPIIGTSGKAGPKLKQGDRQIPEGFYRLYAFYPNSIAHLGLRVDYPNAFDRARAKADGRKDLGGDILIHGSYWSTGCLAMGNTAIEELFVLAHDTGLENIEVIFAPCDLSTRSPEIDYASQPGWVKTLHGKIKNALLEFPFARQPSWLSEI